MSDTLDKIDAWCAALIASLEPAQRSQLARTIAGKLRASQAKRIAAQLNPDGSSYAPRKPQIRKKAGRIRRTMFAKLRTAKYMKAESTADGAAVTFIGQVQRMAKEHQFGLRGRVTGNIETDYPQRQLLGLTDAEEQMVTDEVLKHLAG